MAHQNDGRGSGYGGEQSRFGFRQGGTRNKKGLLGLQNLGNTCFMNAAIQCMTHTHGLQKYFRTCSHAYTSKGQSSRQKLLMAFAHWFERDWGKNVSANYHSPEDILRSVQQLNPQFQGYSQQDSQEFLRFVLDSIHEELRREVPDDLQGHLRRSFGIEAQGELAALGNNAAPSSLPSSLNRGSSVPRNVSLNNAGSNQGASSKINASSARQFMQMCNSTEGTDIGEIRLPEAPSSSSQSSSAGYDQRGKGAMGDDSSHNESDVDSTAASSASTKTSKENQKEDEEEKMHFTSVISELYQGRVVSVVQCLECNQTSKTHEMVYDVSVPIPNANELGEAPGAAKPAAAGLFGGFPGKVKGWFYDKGVEVTDCLHKYCAPEYLTGKDKVLCERCKRKNDCTKRIAFKELPEVLCVHIKRFRYETGWFNGSKNSKVVTFPVNRPLDMSVFLDEMPPQAVEYQLVGLIQHIGSMGGGHYISYCRHKRKPQDWYEFDDMQVSQVSAEQVERAEPYVLFYQRTPSKGSKHDRLTFKNDMRLVQSQIRTFLMSQSAGDGSSSSQSGMSDSVMFHGPGVRSLYKKPPSDLDIVFVSKHWYVRLTSMSDPGPLDNYRYLCPHQLLGCRSSEMASEPFIPISRNLWQGLVKKYGGGPVINSLEMCPKCQTYIRAYNERKQAELELVSKYDTKDTGEGMFWYLVDALWVNKWKRYVRAEDANEIFDVSSPGAITNARLFDKENPGQVRAKLKLRVDYIGVNARVWWLFMHVHGGGPSICREELDMYSADVTPETDLFLDELQGKGAAEYSRRISQQFVDECKGDLEAYRRKYGTPGENDMQIDLDASNDDMEDVSNDDLQSRKYEVDEQMKRLSTEVEELRRRKEQERQLIAHREELQQCQSRQKSLREAGAACKVPKETQNWQDEPRASDPDEQLAVEVQKGKELEERLVELERELLADRPADQNVDEELLAKEEELRRSRLALQKLLKRSEEQNISLRSR